MAVSKKKKEIKQGGTPAGGIRSGGNPDSILACNPSWRFLTCDSDGTWAFSDGRLHDTFWSVIFPKLREFESMTWDDITLKAKKQNHTIEVAELNKVARDKLDTLHVEAESLVSLRLGSTIRLYGFLVGAVYNILWYDDNHGDNDTCVCRSTLKHT